MTKRKKNKQRYTKLNRHAMAHNIMYGYKKSLKNPNKKSEAINGRRTDNTMTERKKNKQRYTKLKRYVMAHNILYGYKKSLKNPNK